MHASANNFGTFASLKTGVINMQLVNILLTIGLVVLVSGITVLSLCAVVASSKSDQASARNRIERRKNTKCSFPIVCEDGTKVYFDRRLQNDRNYA